MNTVGRRLGRFCVAVIAITFACGCKQGDQGEQSVVLYTSVDEPYVRPIVQEFERRTGIRVTLITDAEASKSVGLAEKLRAEKDHPMADVWWSNECFLTINLAGDGVLAPYSSPSSSDLPAQFKDPEGRWAGSVLRVRMLASAAAHPTNWVTPTHLHELLRRDLKDKTALARPTAGTTGGHIASLFVLWGPDRAGQFLRGLHDNGVKLVGGNSIVAESIARGDLLAGVCDNDDAYDASTNVGKLEAVLPDQGEGEDGTLAMPCTVGLVANCPHPDAGKKLIDFILSPGTDRKLVEAHFAWCSARDMAGKGKFMKIDYHAVARQMAAAIRAGTAILEGR
jgi:iron(III) transport system substrate-binding protein